MSSNRHTQICDAINAIIEWVLLHVLLKKFRTIGSTPKMRQLQVDLPITLLTNMINIPGLNHLKMRLHAYAHWKFVCNTLTEIHRKGALKTPWIEAKPYFPNTNTKRVTYYSHQKARRFFFSSLCKSDNYIGRIAVIFPSNILYHLHSN
jgi:hypothetical protein